MKTIVFLVLACIVIFCFAGCNAKDSPEHTGMPDPEVVRRQKTVEKVNIVYGADKASVTLHKPSNAYFEISPEKAQSAGERVWLSANDSSWRAEIFSTVYSESSEQNEAFAEYYYKGKLSDCNEEFEYFLQEITDLKIMHMGKPVKLIKSTYKRTGEKDAYEAWFVGFEFDDVKNVTHSGKGLMGFKIYSIGKEFSPSYLKMLFNELFYIER